ncbi:MAG: glycosyltransferase family 4 protein [Actinobacteria bacterium]|nr:glycosyltransferase family 4 protein [Actinomycetota bacterium]
MTASPVRVMLVVPSAKRAGGGDVWLESLLAGLVTHGIETTVVFEEHGELLSHATRCGHATAVLDAAVGSQPGGLRRLAEPLASLIGSDRPQVTVFWSPRAQVYGAAAHRMAGRPGRTAWVQHVMPSRFWLHRAASEAPSDLVICVSRAVQARQEELYPWCRTAVVCPGLSMPAGVLSRSAARSALGHEGGTLIGVVGRIEPWKGQDIAVQMLAALPAGIGSLALIGERRSAIWPEFADHVETLARNLGVSADVIFAGHVREAAAYLRALDVLVCASREEGFGLAALEAMAGGVPVVATRCGGPEDLVEHEVTGLLTAPEDPAALARAVRRVLADPDLAGRVTAGAKLLHRRQFTSGATATRFAAVLTHLADGPQAERWLPGGSVVGHQLQFLCR